MSSHIKDLICIFVASFITLIRYARDFLWQWGGEDRQSRWTKERFDGVNIEYTSSRVLASNESLLG
jgi:hypothetical protein